jgi:hypothetical protein
MLQLTLAYVQQVDRERDVAADLRNRQTLQPTPQAMAPADSPAAAIRTTRRAPAHARATTR